MGARQRRFWSICLATCPWSPKGTPGGCPFPTCVHALRPHIARVSGPVHSCLSLEGHDPSNVLKLQDWLLWATGVVLGFRGQPSAQSPVAHGEQTPAYPWWPWKPGGSVPRGSSQCHWSRRWLAPPCQDAPRVQPGAHGAFLGTLSFTLQKTREPPRGRLRTSPFFTARETDTGWVEVVERP